ncbi:MAG: PD-(D/E)XK nuclease-like domain-containing protein [Clostridia bacterium]|nr:PD-(D/E)XK nuclease-like domain-containing protein [Clostridia bacterium]
MTEQEYRSAPGINKSTLWNIHKSPAHYQYCLTHVQEDTQSYKFGRAFHSAILTPTAFKNDFIVLPDSIDRRTKAGKEEYAAFLESAQGKEIITSQDYNTIRSMVKAFRKNRDAVDLLKGTKREKPIFWTDNNDLLCKCRVDAYKNGVMIDLKTAADAGTDTFTREALRYGYHVQAAHYIDGYYHTVSRKTPEWYFIVIEKTEPFAVNILKADMGFLDYGFLIRDKLLSILMNCQKTGSFPGYGINDLCLPGYIAEE